MGHVFLRFHSPSDLPGSRKSRNARAFDRLDACNLQDVHGKAT
jgi:hypothetical protein